MFRKKSLSKMNEPESLDQLLVVVTPRAVSLLLSLALVLLVAITWSVVSRLPVTVEGFGIIIKPGSVKSVQFPGTGILSEINVKVGDTIEVGDVIATMRNADRIGRINSDVVKFQAKQLYFEDNVAASQKRTDLEVDLVRKNIDVMKNDILALRQLRAGLSQQTKTYSAEELATLSSNRQLLLDLYNTQKSQLDSIIDLASQGALASSQQVQMLSTITETERRIAELDLQISNANTTSLNNERQDIKLRQEISQLVSRLTQEEIRYEQLLNNFILEKNKQQMDLNEIGGNIRLSKERLFRQTYVASPYSGKVLEIRSSTGQNVAGGKELLTIEIASSEPFNRIVFAEDVTFGSFALNLNGETTRQLGYPTTAPLIEAALNDIAKSRAGPPLKVVERRQAREYDVFSETSQSILLEIDDNRLNTVEEVPSFASVFSFDRVMQDEKLSHLCFFPIGDGKKVVNGMKMLISPSNVDRNRFGSIIGKVTSVSSFPATSEGIVKVTGNSDVAAALVEKGGTLLVYAAMTESEDDNKGYRWSSKGFDGSITSGTTTSCRISIEERAPITFVIPLLRKWFLGIDGANVPSI